jgi:hypothetical protein
MTIAGTEASFHNEIVVGWLIFLVYNVAINNILVILWRSVLLVEEVRVPGENHDLLQVTDKFYHIMLYISSTIHNFSGDRY